MKITLSILLFTLAFVLTAGVVDASVLRGKASWYSRAGCLGCSKNFTMANGEPLDDSANTIALTPSTINKYGLMNKFVGIINMRTHDWVIAKITDSGGFAKYNRVADLSKAVKEQLNCSSLCDIELIW